MKETPKFLHRTARIRVHDKRLRTGYREVCMTGCTYEELQNYFLMHSNAFAMKIQEYTENSNTGFRKFTRDECVEYLKQMTEKKRKGTDEQETVTNGFDISCLRGIDAVKE